MNIPTFILSQRNTVLFTVLIAISMLCAWLINQQVLTQEVYYRSMGEQLTMDQIDSMLTLQNKYEWVSYLFVALTGLIKYSLIATVLYTGVFLAGFKVGFGRIFKLVLVAEFVMLLPMLIKTIWFTLVGSDYSLEDIQYFYPLSLLSVVDYKQVDALWYYPLQVLNVFELLYWIALGWGLHTIIQKDFDRSLRIVLGSYLPALVLWIVVVMFLTVTFNPAA